MSVEPPPPRSSPRASPPLSSHTDPHPPRAATPGTADTHAEEDEWKAAAGEGTDESGGSTSASRAGAPRAEPDLASDPELVQRMAMMGFRPSPTTDTARHPLTPLDTHAQPRTPDSEMDIGALSASWREDDLGSATTAESKDGVPSADHALHIAFGAAGAQHAHTDEHPLRLDVHPPSPPPWETMDPPATNGGRDPYGSSHTRIVHEFSGTKPLRSRPLIPYSSYYFGPPPPDAAYGTPPVGQIGVHHPREVVRIERDYSAGELPQFAAVYPLEFEGRLTPTQFLETVNDINEILISAHSLGHSFLDNTLSFFTLQASRLVKMSHYEKEMRRLQRLIEDRNARLYNPVGLNILWPRRVAFMFLEVEYY
ncbi:hypothetical protein POSPLADRAFT_1177077 [Postia placenta MAD-698-R-SB12]|uniref:Ras modification protein ERF4 n=1 Tax=Postia placenta MAD-698-R-SB12 TaxID=670580 RepID=A0A1X6NHF8_9APHY|nr:hypothetical protein POSPLADRAFT_1177077 [Postia placenta MAD-698-R-SB12]OSX68061.1 hypothetical protein POSPLADRAFT_1177077 [Postia placenta MAD-698-R-SB12]